MDRVNEYSCLCPPAFTGTHGELDVDECSVRPSLCHNGATCTTSPGSYSCICVNECQRAASTSRTVQIFDASIAARCADKIETMLGDVAGRHVASRRRGSNPLVRGSVGLIGYGATSGIGGAAGNAADGGATHLDTVPRYAARRRRAVTTSDHKSCALIQTRLKLGDIM
ncbi:uncharacterized protein [Temnothorax longispinosus]|uniref:uncharacterized protein n=1 Tax=Temnothorax longispinosus TaxID=300112 RepID=UPI003A994E6A